MPVESAAVPTFHGQDQDGRRAAGSEDNLAKFLRTLAVPDEVEGWALSTLREKVVKIGAKVIAHAHSTVFQMAEVAVPRALFGRILERIGTLRPKPVLRC